MKKVRFATIGTSMITRSFIEASRQCSKFELLAVYSRSSEKAEQFGREYGAPRFYTSLEDLAADAEIDAVYIASPNSLHEAQTMRMLRAGKHVLCEKALAANAWEAEQMVRTAREQGVVLLEAMRVLYDPGFLVIERNLHKLGTIRQASFQFGKYSSKYDDFKAGIPCNIFSPEFAAGGLMDIGIYCMEPMIALFGNPRNVTASAVLLDDTCCKGKMLGDTADVTRFSGRRIDGAGTILANYDGMLAELTYSKITNLMGTSQITGENGTMRIPTLVPPRDMEIVYRDGCHELLPIENAQGEYVLSHSLEPKSNMLYETEFFIHAIQTGADVSRYQQISLDSLAWMDEARRQMGVEFPADRDSSGYGKSLEVEPI